MAIAERIRVYLSFVRFSHSVFALPFALAGAILALDARSRAGQPLNLLPVSYTHLTLPTIYSV